MRKYIAILVAALTAAGIYAREIKSDQPVTVTGKLGFYRDKEDGTMITITSNDVVVPSNPDEWYLNVEPPVPVQRVAIDLRENDPRFRELKKAAAEGKSVTLRGSSTLWARHVKRAHPDVLLFQLAP